MICAGFHILDVYKSWMLTIYAHFCSLASFSWICKYCISHQLPSFDVCEDFLSVDTPVS